MYGLREVLVQQELLVDYRRQAQSWRLARLAQMRRSALPRRPALAWLGRQMMHLGRRLEAQYGA